MVPPQHHEQSMGSRRSLTTDTAFAVRRPRRGLTLAEVIVSLAILGGVLLALGMFSARLSQATSQARIRITAAQLASERIEQIKSAPRYSMIESVFVATEANLTSQDSIGRFTRRTWVTRVGGALTDTIDYKIVTVQVSQANTPGTVRKTTVIAPF
jgi:prepilin-type N-terminal cleavage/methylation domain-containing protein